MTDARPAGGEQAAYQANPHVAAPHGDAVLLVPILDGAADLRRVVALRGVGLELWQELASEPVSIDALSQRLARTAAAARAESDAKSFVRELIGAGLLNGPVPAESIPDATKGDAPATPAAATDVAPTEVTLDSDDVRALAERILAGGHALRLLARGRSMRPQLPDGSVLEVAARPFAQVRVGEIALYSAGAHRLVAHRVLGRRGEFLLARGDSAARADAVAAHDYLGVVVARLMPGGAALRRVDLTTGLRRVTGRIASGLHRAWSVVVRNTVVRPMRHSAWLRGAVSAGLRVASGGLRRLERLGSRGRRRVDVARAGLMTTPEKDEDRRRLYAGKTVRDFTALDENVAAGLTLIEEVLLARHPIDPSTAPRVLVVGCGPGRECLALAERGFEVTGLDRDAGMLERARQFAARSGRSIRFAVGEADRFELPGERFDRVVVFSGLYNMLLPRARRVALLRAARAHLAPGGKLLLTFLSDYAAPGSPPPLPASGVLAAINPEHEAGDRYLLNEAVHIFPHADHVAFEARQAGFAVEELYRDQRAYDRATRQVRGYAVLVVEDRAGRDRGSDDDG